MNIVILTSFAKSLYNFRGPLIKSLVEQGHEVFALAPDYDEQSRLLIWNLGAKPIDCKLTRAKINPIKDFFHTLMLARQIRYLKPDSILCYSIKPVIFGGLAAFLARVPNRLAMIEGLGYLYTYETSELGIIRRSIRKIVDFLYKLALHFQHKVIFLNQDDVNEFVRYGLVDFDKTVMLGGIGVDLDEWNVEAKSSRSGSLTFTFVGRLLKEKGVIEYLDAAKIIKDSYPNVRFILLGDKDENPGSLSTDLVMEYVDSGIVHWPGQVDVKGWLKMTSVFVLPSYREGVPRSTQEAMAMGLPVITTDVPGCRDTVIDGVNGFIVPAKDSAALAEAMQKIINNPKMIKSMGQASRNIAVTKFDIHKINKILISLLHDKNYQNK